MTDIDLDALRWELVAAERPTPQGSGAVWDLSEKRDRAAKVARQLLARIAELEAEREELAEEIAETKRRRQKTPTDGPSATVGQDPGEVGCPTCRTILRPSAVPGGCADPWHAENEPVSDGMNQPLTADPPGLAEAIEAMRASLPNVGVDPASQWAQTLPLEHLARAAAPILTRAALQEAADEIAAVDADGACADGLNIAEQMVRDRADRIGG